MRLSISNIAWDPRHDTEVAELLARYRVDAIDVAPAKYFPKPEDATATDIARVRQWWHERGVEITGMQALLFGTTGLNLFGAPPVQDAMLARLDAVCRIAAGLGATRLVFGSPKNRDRTALSDDKTTDIAARFFRRLGDVAAAHAVTICLEAYPERYGCNFMTGTDDAADVVRRVGHPAIRLQLDTGTLAANNEDPMRVVKSHADLFGHVHASEPGLVALGDGGAAHEQVCRSLNACTAINLVAIEMLESKVEPPLVAIERALQVADHAYRSGAHARAAAP